MAAYMSIPEGLTPWNVFGEDYRLLGLISDRLPEAELQLRGNQLRFTEGTESASIVAALLAELFDAAEAGQPLGEDEISGALNILAEQVPGARHLPGAPTIETGAVKVRPKSPNQQAYVEAIDNNTVVFGTGPAGSGKTFLAMAKAVEAFLRGDCKRILLSRPVVEAGEHLGFLPGGLEEKLDPYLRPLYDALNEMLPPGDLPRLMADGVIEVAPLAYMRGRTLSNAFIILDEAQNSSPEQMKMFLTRLGFSSKMIITGDMSQCDLGNKASGLRAVRSIVEGIEGLAWCDLTSDDVVRHPLVSAIVDAYDRAEQ